MNEETKQIEQGCEPVSENIWLCPDGVYRWVYEYDMLRNPTIMISVWKVLGIAFGVVFVFDLLLTLFNSVLSPLEAMQSVGKLFLILAGVFLVLSVISYIIVAAMYGWKYQVLFEMTEEQVTHIQMPKQFKKTEAIGWLTAFVGAMAGSSTTMAAGLLSASKSTSMSEFKNVEIVKIRRKRHTIHVNQLLDKNQVYAEDADFDFVEKFILDRCVKAKIR